MRQNRRIRGVRAHRDCALILPHPTFLWASESSSSFLLCAFTSAYPRWSSQEDSAIRNSSSPFTIARSLARARAHAFTHTIFVFMAPLFMRVTMSHTLCPCPMCSHQVPNGFPKFPSYTMSRARQSVQVNSQKVWAQKKLLISGHKLKWYPSDQAIEDLSKVPNFGPSYEDVLIVVSFAKKDGSLYTPTRFFLNSFINVIIVIFNHWTWKL